MLNQRARKYKTYLYLYIKGLNQDTRYACDLCIIKKIHKHGLSNEDHLKR